jgi:hypothetical protein
VVEALSEKFAVFRVELSEINFSAHLDSIGRGEPNHFLHICQWINVNQTLPMTD